MASIPLQFSANATGSTLVLTIRSDPTYMPDAGHMGGVSNYDITLGYSASVASFGSAAAGTGYTAASNGTTAGTVSVSAFASDAGLGQPPGSVLATITFTLKGATPADFPLTISNTALNDDAPASGTADPSVACFVRGTRIMTVDGPVAVEKLQAGDQVMTLGGPLAVTWVGRRRIACGAHPEPHDVMPVRIHAGALSAGVPERDLVLSPDHGLCFDGALIPVRYLVNGATIVQETWSEVTYFHVELERHAVLFAEGAAAESYLDTGNRGSYDGVTTVVTLPAHALAIWAAKACAPLVFEGSVLERVRAGLLARAEAAGHATTVDPGLHLLVDGAVIQAERDGQNYSFALPAGARSVRLRSRRFVPGHLVPGSADYRMLGVAVTRITLNGRACEIGASDGWYASEAGVQWTDGDAGVAGLAGILAVSLAPIGRYWAAGQPALVGAVRAA